MDLNLGLNFGNKNDGGVTMYPTRIERRFLKFNASNNIAVDNSNVALSEVKRYQFDSLNENHRYIRATILANPTSSNTEKLQYVVLTVNAPDDVQAAVRLSLKTNDVNNKVFVIPVGETIEIGVSDAIRRIDVVGHSSGGSTTSGHTLFLEIGSNIEKLTNPADITNNNSLFLMLHNTTQGSNTVVDHLDNFPAQIIQGTLEELWDNTGGITLSGDNYSTTTTDDVIHMTDLSSSEGHLIISFDLYFNDAGTVGQDQYLMAMGKADDGTETGFWAIRTRNDGGNNRLTVVYRAADNGAGTQNKNVVVNLQDHIGSYINITIDINVVDRIFTGFINGNIDLTQTFSGANIAKPNTINPRFCLFGNSTFTVSGTPNKRLGDNTTNPRMRNLFIHNTEYDPTLAQKIAVDMTNNPGEIPASLL